MAESVDQEVSKFFDKKFLEWQIETGGSRTRTQFAKYLGVEPGTLGHWMSGRNKPDEQNCLLLSKKFGYEVFNVCGYIGPDLQFRRVASLWHKADERGQSIIVRIVTEAVNQEKTDYGSESPIPDEELASIEQRTASKDSSDSLPK